MITDVKLSSFRKCTGVTQDAIQKINKRNFLDLDA